MADQFITELDAITTYDDTDLVVIEHAPSGTPETNKMTVADFQAELLNRVAYQINRTISSNNATISIKNGEGNNATSAKPLLFNIHGTIRKVTGSLSITLNAGSSLFNLGSAELKTLAQELFVYVGWRASDSSVFILLSRMSHIREMADFSATTTSERYGAYSGSAPAGTDKVTVIGRINIQNSGSASFNWSIPTSDIIINRPIYETTWLDWTPQFSTSGSLTYTSTSITIARYKIQYNQLQWVSKVSGTLGGTASTDIYETVPFEASQSANAPIAGSGNTATVAAKVFISAGTPDKIGFQKYDTSNYATSGTNVINGMGFYEIQN